MSKKIPIRLSSRRDRAIWDNAERTAKRVRARRRFYVRLTCCGRDDGMYGPVPWDEADAFRETYLNADGHDRSAIVVASARNG